MEENDILVKNILKLMDVHGFKNNAAQATKHINEVCGDDALDRSYMARILKNSSKDPVNVSVKKISTIAKGFGVEAWQMLNPQGFDDRGFSRAATVALDKNAIRKAVDYSINATTELEIEDQNCIAECITETYSALITGKENSIPTVIAKVVRKY